MPPIRVMLVDDHPVVRTGIRALIERAPDIVVIAEFDDGVTALRELAVLQPDVIVLDMELPGLNGVDVARQVHACGAAARILALSAYDDAQYIFGLLEVGAAGYLTKDEAVTSIVDAVRGVARGETGWLSRRVLARLMPPQPATLPSPVPPLARLSARERQVLHLVAQGQDNLQIAATLGVAMDTVKNHISNIYTKLGVRTRAEAVAWFWQHARGSTAHDIYGYNDARQW